MVFDLSKLDDEKMQVALSAIQFKSISNSSGYYHYLIYIPDTIIFESNNEFSPCLICDRGTMYEYYGERSPDKLRNKLIYHIEKSN